MKDPMKIKNKAKKIINLLKDKDLDAAYRIGKFNHSKPRDILIKFRNSDQRDAVFRKKKILKGQKLFINEDYCKRFEIDNVCNNIDIDPNYNFFRDNVNFENFNNCKYYFVEALNQSEAVNSIDNSLSMLNVNINSIPRNFDNFMSGSINILNFNFDILSFCETKLNDDIDELYTIDGYQKFTNNNSRNSGDLRFLLKIIFQMSLLEKI